VFLGAPRAVETLSDDAKARIAALNADGKTVSVLVVDGAATGLIAMRDTPRETAKSGLSTLKTLGVTPIMLTGDNARTAEAIAAELGLEARADLLPADKQGIVTSWQAE